MKSFDLLSSLDMEFGRPMRVFDQHFGMGLNDEDIILSSYSPYYSRGRRLYTRQQSGVAEMKCENEKWQVGTIRLNWSKSKYSRFLLMYNTSHLKSSPSELWTISCGWRGSMRRNKMSTGNKLRLQTDQLQLQLMGIK